MTPRTVQKRAVSTQSPLTVPAKSKPHDKAKMFKAASVGSVTFAVGDVLELEDDEESGDEEEDKMPLLGLVQCIFSGPDASDVDIQVLLHLSSHSSVGAGVEQDPFDTPCRGAHTLSARHSSHAPHAGPGHGTRLCWAMLPRTMSCS
jgi:hypothetical protein